MCYFDSSPLKKEHVRIRPMKAYKILRFIPPKGIYTTYRGESAGFMSPYRNSRWHDGMMHAQSYAHPAFNNNPEGIYCFKDENDARNWMKHEDYRVSEGYVLVELAISGWINEYDEAVSYWNYRPKRYAGYICQTAKIKRVIVGMSNLDEEHKKKYTKPKRTPKKK